MHSGRGGKRKGAGRPQGASNVDTRRLQRRIAETPGTTLIERLAAIVEDPSVPIDEAMMAARHVFGALLSVTIRNRLLKARNI
jgi:hypothetical protein